MMPREQSKTKDGKSGGINIHLFLRAIAWKYLIEKRTNINRKKTAVWLCSMASQIPTNVLTPL
jgi:hypothetical protein